MILQLYRKQLSNKALTIDNGGQLFFIPSSFEHTIVDKHFVNVTIPEWFLKENQDVLKKIESNTKLTLQRLCEL